MKVKITINTFVRIEKGAEVEVSEAEAKRLMAIGCAEEVKKPKKSAK